MVRLYSTSQPPRIFGLHNGCLSSYLVVGCPLEDSRDQWSSYPNVGYAVRGLYPSKIVVFMKLELAILLPQLHFGKGQTRMHSSDLVLCAVPL
jgi:hypothetical protein